LSDQGRKLLRDRIARLAGKMAVVQIGGATDSEIIETRDKIVDGFNAVKLGMKHVRYF
jgi:chaperonin GroEL